jgi:hypothetical protein
MLRYIALCASCLILSGSTARSQPSQMLLVPADSARWDLQGQAKAAEYQGRKCLFLDGGEAMLKGLEMRDGVIDVDVATPASRGFFGIQFRIASDGANAEWVYLRQHKSGLPDALQYTPVLNTGLPSSRTSGTQSGISGVGPVSPRWPSNASQDCRPTKTVMRHRRFVRPSSHCQSPPMRRPCSASRAVPRSAPWEEIKGHRSVDS